MDGEELITIKKKLGFFKSEYELYDKGNKIALLKQKLLSIKPKITTTTKDNNYSIKGDLMATNFTIYKNNIDIAQVKKVKLTLKDTYKIDIFEDELICLSILIIIDNSIHN